MDSQQNTFLPPPIDGGEASAPLAQPDDDFVTANSAAGTPNTPADDAGTGSTVSPVSPVHLNRQKINAMMIDDDQVEADNDNGATDDSAGLLPPPDETDTDDKSTKDTSTTVTKNDNDAQWSEKPLGDDDDDDDQVPVLAMSGILPATATGGGGGGGGGGAGTGDSKKNVTGSNDPTSGGAGGTVTGNGENKSNEKSRYASGNGAGGGTDQDDSGANNSQAPLGCGTTLEYVLLITTCTILLLSVTGTTIYWTMVYRGGYDCAWFPWPPQTPKQLLSVGIFTYKHHSQNSQNFSDTNVDFGAGNSFGESFDGNYSTTSTIATSTPEQLSTQYTNKSSKIDLTDEQRFNLHPTLMTFGFITFTGFSILVYRMAAGCSTTCRGTYVKLTHSLLHLATVPCVLFGSVASMEYHRSKGIPHLYSLHSWMGVLTVSLFIIQFTLGIFTFVVLLCCRGATAACRLRCFAPIHATLGLCTFTLAIATCLTGLQQRADFMIFNNNGSAIESETIKQKLHVNKEPVVVNILAVLLVFVFIVVSYTVRRESIKRKSNNKSPYTATMSPLRVKSSSSTGKFGSVKQSSLPPV
ncbi:Hypothetical protein CINCED_3A001754 [Cinara cedri]|uniref:Cytochrome b561 domain-containing protein n=1 Tax=Cinara cedri TaxID=506608 RepID=A0A5E4MYG5_9HEMI|nr:Hypothetical protein CINCED_3A001754 [Cinara cedri]